MKERPILFSAPMVRALLDGSKTQTRRIVKPQPVMYEPGQCVGVSDMINDSLVCPYGQPGNRLWVRETHRPIWSQTPGYLINVDYRADPREKWERLGDQIGMPTKWTPSIHMRREYSRILLEIVSVRVERLNEIGVEEIQAEGVQTTQEAIMVDGCRARVVDFANLWESINGAGSWAANPWVWVVEFRRLEADRTAAGPG